jgi:hypothetical protein
MDQPADLLSHTPVRLRSILAHLSRTGLWHSAAVARWCWTDALPWLADRLAAALSRLSATVLRWLTATAARRLAITTILAFAVIAVTAAPAYAARLARADLWNLAPLLDGSRPDVASNTLATVLASIVVLAVVSAHSGRHHDHW